MDKRKDIIVLDKHLVRLKSASEYTRPGKLEEVGEIKMSKPWIQLISCESGDWEVLRVNLGEDFHAEGHSINNHMWIDLLKNLGYEVEKVYISDEDMENGNY